MTDDRSKMRHGDMPLLDRIEVALRRVTNGEGQMRVPVEATDPDVVLFDCRREIERLRAELAEAKRDAERWRTFSTREDLVSDIVIALEVYGTAHVPESEQVGLDSPTVQQIIDAARGAE